MAVRQSTKAARIRAGLGHPVIDADGHTIEVTPVLNDYISQVGGPNMLARFESITRPANHARTTYEERRETWDQIPVHWVWPADTLDRATASLPRLYHERLEELGIDFSLVYPTLGLRYASMDDDELRPVVCRALNMYMTELHRGLDDRILPVATIPMHTPDEAIIELEYAVNVLGMRVVVIPSFVRRPIPRVHREHPEYDAVAYRFDTYGVDGEYDYDSVWAKCVELKVVPGVHTPTNGVAFRRSISNYIYNHIGSFATSCEAFCKSLLLGGVFHRFPKFKVAALEGGVGWAASLYADFLGHWEKRNGKSIHQLNPERLDRTLLTSLFEEYGPALVQASANQIIDSIQTPGLVPDTIDEFSACPFDSPEEIRDLFVSHIYIGCEADDPMNALAFNSRLNPHGARFRVLFGSDISHWDVPNVAEVLAEAYELVERELITEEDFRDFTFTNPALLYAGTNPEFFHGSRVDIDVRHLLSC